MQTDNLDYFRRRALEERQAAALAHLKMADEYQRRVDELCDRPELKQVL